MTLLRVMEMFLWRDAEGRALDSLREGRRMVEARYAIIRHEVCEWRG
jgi:hypothetical protein